MIDETDPVSYWREIRDFVTITCLKGNRVMHHLSALRALGWLAGIILATLIATNPAAAADDCLKPDWKVDSVRLGNNARHSVTDYVELGDTLLIKSAQLGDLRKCADGKGGVVLFLNGQPVPEMVDYPPSNPADSEASFTLQITDKDQALWAKLLGRPSPGAKRIVKVSIGLANSYPLQSDLTVPLRPLPSQGLAIWAGMFVIALGSFLWLASRSGLLRGGTPAGGNIFSLSRCQAAWWFFIVLGAYMLIGVTTGDFANSLNSTALILLGIAAATHLGSAAIDASKATAGEADAQDKARADLNAKTNRTPAEQSKLDKLNGRSQGWLMDVLSDADGIDFHRFQNLVWTFVLGIIFIVDVWRNLAMPVFSETLLGLMGLSAVTFVGLKIPETTK